MEFCFAYRIALLKLPSDRLEAAFDSKSVYPVHLGLPLLHRGGGGGILSISGDVQYIGGIS